MSPKQKYLDTNLLKTNRWVVFITNNRWFFIFKIVWYRRFNCNVNILGRLMKSIPLHVLMNEILVKCLIHGGITWPYEELNSLVFSLCNVYSSKEFNSSYDIQHQRVQFFI